MKIQDLAAVAMFLLGVSPATAEVVIETVTVGNPGNAGELSGPHANGIGEDRICGAVNYVYNIGTFEVTAGQYTEFLNAVAATDTYQLYNPSMSLHPYGCRITQNGTSGSYTYDFSGRPSGTEADWADRPVNFVSWGDAARFANWLHNGQPTGVQDLHTTEAGSYFLNGATTTLQLMAVVRAPDATWVIPSEDEWYKAAYHKNDGATPNYFDYPTSSDSTPDCVGDGESISSPDPGNYATHNCDEGIVGIGPPYYRTEVGEHENSASPYGTFDQGGNVWEWNEAVFPESYRGRRGAAYVSFSFDDAMHAAWRYPLQEPSFEYNYAGFRVARIPDREDFDNDGDVDLHDYARFQVAITGPR